MGRLLLITPTPLAHLDGGTVFLRRVVEAIPSDGLAWIACGGHGQEPPAWMARFPRLVLPPSLLNHRYARALAVRTPLRQRYLREVYVDRPVRALDEARAFARANGVTQLYVYGSGPAIALGQRLARDLAVPMHVSLHDDIRGWHTPADLAVIEPELRALLAAATTADVATDALGRMYRERYGVGPTARSFLIGGGAGDLPAPPAIAPRARRIAYAGGVWCPDAFDALCAGIRAASRDGSPAFTLTLFGTRPPRAAFARLPFVQFGGLLPMQDVPRVLNGFDLLYCPMSFLPELRSLSEFSLPSKLLTYFQAQVPIIAHGPAYASHVALTREHDAGLVITSRDAAEIARALEAYAADAPQRTRHAAVARRLAQTTYESSHVVGEFLSFLATSAST